MGWPRDRLLESGKLQLPREEAGSHRAAAEYLHEKCEVAFDPSQPMTVEEWIVLELAHAALGGEHGLLDHVIARVEAEIETRTLRNWTREPAKERLLLRSGPRPHVAAKGGYSSPLDSTRMVGRSSKPVVYLRVTPRRKG
jgi:hypothetical protein